MKSLLLTKEFPPNVYGGAGVHVDYLSRALKEFVEVEVRCFGDQQAQDGNLSVTGFALDSAGTSQWTAPPPLHSVFDSIGTGLAFSTTDIDADVVHCHTWYSYWGGIVAKLNYGLPLVVTGHSLEPLRPWKREQLGGGYDFSLWVEKTAIEMADAVIAVSEGTKAEILELFDVDPARVHVIYNGIDVEEYQPTDPSAVLARYEIDPDRPYVMFLGRITRQKGIIHLVRALPEIDAEVQIVLCAGAPDTPEIAAEMSEAVDAVRAAGRDGVFWIDEMVDDATKIALYSGAAVFCSPSIYEPFGIINLEAMACRTPVVASAVGGQKEVVVDGQTGFLVELEQQTESPFEPVDPVAYSHDLAVAINAVLADPDQAGRMAEAGQERAAAKFSWRAIAEETAALYGKLQEGRGKASS